MSDISTEFLDHQILNHSNLYIFSKDRHGRYIYCNENLARIAEADSPHQVVGKTDHDFIWRNQASMFQYGDYMTMRGRTFVNRQEPLQQANTTLDILVSKYPLKNKYGHCAGIIGSFLDITGHFLIKKNRHYHPLNGHYSLGPKFDNKYLTKREVSIIKHLLRGYTVKSIAKAMLLSPRTVESHLINIRHKLQVNSKAEIISTLIENDLAYIFNVEFSPSLIPDI